MRIVLAASTSAGCCHCSSCGLCVAGGAGWAAAGEEGGVMPAAGTGFSSSESVTSRIDVRLA